MMIGRFVPVCVALTLFLRSSEGTFPEKVVGAFESTSNNDLINKNLMNLSPEFDASGRSLSMLDNTGFARWTITTSFGFERQYCTEHNFSSSGSFKDLQYDQVDDAALSDVFLQVVWLPNEDRLYEKIFHETTTLRSSGTTQTESLLTPVTNTVTEGSSVCTFETAGTEVRDSGVATIIHLQFMIYVAAFNTPSSPNQASSTDGSLHTGTFSISSAPMRVAVGYLLLARTSDASSITSASIQDIMALVAPKFCVELDSTVHNCCIQGTATSGGETCSSCNQGYFGACCTKTCSNGIVTILPPFNSTVCQCNMNWGGEQCNRVGASEHFVSMARYTAKQCQNEVTNHLPYHYDNAYEDRLMAIITETRSTNEVSFGIDGSLSIAIYGQSYTSPPLIAVSDTWNDFLFAASIDKPTTHTGNFSIKVSSEIRGTENFNGNSNSSGVGTIDTCVYMYDIIQRYAAASSAAIAEIFFVIGQVGYSTFPNKTMLDTEKTEVNSFPVEADTWTVTGTGMTGIVMGYNFVAKSGPGAIPNSELLKVLECYAAIACNSLPATCRFGAAQITDNGPRCVCDHGWLGSNCNLPLC